ncbi:MAG TPA: TetR/AcrR family transcriptional regulator [Galbitalea sp.]
MTTTTESEPGAPITRMGADERRALVLEAATEMFGQYGYAGTTTDRVAAAAGVSQPYVVRIFGTKEKLFIAVLHRDLTRLLTAFRAALAEDTDTPIAHRLGLAYADLLKDRGLLLSLMHGFVLGADPEIGKVARCGFLDVYRFLKDEAGISPADASSFLAHGMLLNTLVGIRMTDDYSTDPDARELLEGSLGAKLPLLLDQA